MENNKKIRVLIAKPGLDGHDRGAKYVAKALSDAGMEVIYTGIRQTPESIAVTAVQEDVNVVGLSCLSGAHNSLFPKVVDALKAKGASDMIVFGGGVIPKDDIPFLKQHGINEIFTPGTTIKKILGFIYSALKIELPKEEQYIKKIDHIGMAVPSLEEGVKLYGEGFGLTLGGTEEVPEQKVKVAFFKIGDTNIELLEPTSPDSPVAKFLEKNQGPGIHHVAYEVTNIEKALEAAKARGIKLIDEKPRMGAHGKKIAFLHPKDTLKVLTEYCQSCH
ncbi:MAG TPA: methylmalonyl-CoA epimerase [Candidatus Wallbacteria bacterium]|nr:methylmalonyl-CoA epimerase [Candidatus Wallbacteria bacterium]